MKKTIIITETQLNDLFPKPLITEAASIDRIINAVNKDKLMSRSDIEQLKNILINGDPTAVTNSRGQFVGKYWKWIYNQYKQGNIHLGDQPELEAALNTYNINKSQINRPIDSFNTLDELVEVIADYNDSFKASRTLSKGEQELEKVYEDQYVTVYVPHTWEAARKIGGDTRWCTASSSKHYFNMYLNNYGGEYYDIIRKSDGAKFQLHAESEQFMDSNDDEVTFASVFNSREEASGLINFLKNRGKDISEWNPKTWFSEAQDKLDSGENQEDVFDWCEARFSGNKRVVELNGKYNFVTKDNIIVSQHQWFDNSYDFNEGFARVELNNKWNFINCDGQIISKEWFDWCYDFDFRCKNFSVVENNDKENLLKKDGTLLSKIWFDEIGNNNSNGLMIVRLKSKYNFLKSSDGTLLCDKWYCNVFTFHFGISVVTREDGKTNAINDKGEILSPNRWFSEFYNITDEGVYFFDNGKRYRLNKHGLLIEIIDETKIS